MVIPVGIPVGVPTLGVTLEVPEYATTLHFFVVAVIVPVADPEKVMFSLVRKTVGAFFPGAPGVPGAPGAPSVTL